MLIKKGGLANSECRELPCGSIRSVWAFYGAKKRIPGLNADGLPVQELRNKSIAIVIHPLEANFRRRGVGFKTLAMGERR